MKTQKHMIALTKVCVLIFLYLFPLMSSLHNQRTGIIIVDHGSRVAAANAMLVDVSFDTAQDPAMVNLPPIGHAALKY